MSQQPFSAIPPSEKRVAASPKSTSLTLRDLVFLGILAAVMFGITRGFYPLAVLLGGPILGPGIVHHSIYAIPIGALAALGYARVPKLGAILILGFVFSLINALSIGLWFVFFGFWSGGLLGEVVAFGLRWVRRDTSDGALTAIGGLFLLGLSLLLPMLFALILTHKSGALTGVLYGIGLFSWIVPALLGAVGGFLGARIAIPLRRAGLLP